MKIELPLLFLEFPHPFSFLLVVYSSVHDLSPEVLIVKGTKIGKGGVRANHILGMCVLTDCVCEHCFFVCFFCRGVGSGPSLASQRLLELCEEPT